MKKRFQELLIAQDHFGITPSFMHKGRYQYQMNPTQSRSVIDSKSIEGYHYNDING